MPWLRDERGSALRQRGMLEAPRGSAVATALQAARPCPECGNASVIPEDRCNLRTACGYVGPCGRGRGAATTPSPSDHAFLACRLPVTPGPGPGPGESRSTSHLMYSLR